MVLEMNKQHFIRKILCQYLDKRSLASSTSLSCFIIILILQSGLGGRGGSLCHFVHILFQQYVNPNVEMVVAVSNQGTVPVHTVIYHLCADVSSALRFKI